MASHGYEEVEHTADIALRLWGEDFQLLLRQGAIGFYALMDLTPEPGTDLDVEFTLQSGNFETILVDFLNELLYLVDYKRQYFTSFSFVQRENFLSVQAAGFEIRSQDRHIKAVTFHDLEIKKLHDRLEATITFDV